jgi:hypothetical protein
MARTPEAATMVHLGVGCARGSVSFPLNRAGFAVGLSCHVLPLAV